VSRAEMACKEWDESGGSERERVAVFMEGGESR
jgi:hypothetical protein